MADIDGEHVMTNPTTGEKIVLRGGAWVPYTPKASLAPPPSTLKPERPKSIMGNIQPPFATPPWSAQKEAYKSLPLVPQTPTQAGIDVGMIAGSALAPEAALPGLLTRMGASALGGGIGSKIEGQSAMRGAGQGALQQGIGEVAAPIVNAAGKIGKAALNREDVGRVGKFLNGLLPIGDLTNIDAFDKAFPGGRAARITGKAVADNEARITNIVGDKPIIKIPGLSMQMSGDQRFTPMIPGTLKDATEEISRLNKIGYGAAGDPAQKAAASQARQDAHELTQNVGAQLNKIQQGLGDSFLKVRRQHALSNLMTRIFQDHSIWDRATGRMNWPNLVDSLENADATGWRSDLNRLLGPDTTEKFIAVANRGAPPTIHDIEGKGLMGALGSGMRAFAHPGGVPGLSAHIPMGGQIMGKTVGEVPRRFPPVPPALMGLLASGMSLDDLLQQIGPQNKDENQ